MTNSFDYREKRSFINTLQPSITDYAVPIKKTKSNSEEETVPENNSNDCPKKIVTKGAMKIFEGLKVSIPTQDLDLKEVLKCNKNPEPDTQEIEKVEELIENDQIILKKKTLNKKKSVFKNFGNKLGLRETKKKNTKKHSKNPKEKIQHDIYDFEESQDFNSMFTSNLAVFRSFRNGLSETMDTENKSNDRSKISSEDLKSNIDSESETDRYYDSISYEENSVSSDSITEQELKLKKSDNSLKKDNQKKCMIMGRIFKNASKPKLEDKIPEIRDISSEENSKLVENYLESYSSVDNIESTVEGDLMQNLTIINSANKMSKNEMDFLFDKLLQDNKGASAPKVPLEIIAEKKVPEVKKEDKPKVTKMKKRQRHHSDDSTSTDEFMLHGRSSKSSKKNKKNPRKSTKRKNDSGINLEQEMKECIGVAGRKSQRKCTSGKQNVLVESWSSDESEIDYAALIAEAEAKNQNKTEIKVPEISSNIIDDSLIKEHIENTMEENKDLYEFEPDEFKDEVIEPLSKLCQHGDKTKEKEKHKKSQKNKIENRRHSKSKNEDVEGKKSNQHKKREHSHNESAETLAANRRKRNAVETLYYWSSTSDEDELQDMIEVKPIREDTEDDRPMQHGWIVGDSPKKLVTMLAQAKGKKVDCESVKEQKKSRTTM